MNWFGTLFGNIFSGLGSLFSLPNLLNALDLVGKGLGVYGQIDTLLNPPQLPDFSRLDRQGNQPMPVTLPSVPEPPAPPPTPVPPTLAPITPQERARLFATARRQLAERGIVSGGAFEDPAASLPWLFDSSQAWWDYGNPSDVGY